MHWQNRWGSKSASRRYHIRSCSAGTGSSVRGERTRNASDLARTCWWAWVHMRRTVEKADGVKVVDAFETQGNAQNDRDTCLDNSSRIPRGM